ncbi:MAG: hypothetical protein ACJAT6_001999 [Akkermansiaceae bacterium]|jgi:hypothetical protein|tara:strand:+ start:3197 stop:3310 length:114 start_codon:yes stop_codon:yes gene_type:complete
MKKPDEVIPFIDWVREKNPHWLLQANGRTQTPIDGPL